MGRKGGMAPSTDFSFVWPFLLILASAEVQGTGTANTLYRKIANTRVDDSQQFSLGVRADDRTSCVVACTAHEQCGSVNFRTDDTECKGTSKSYFSFGSSATADNDVENFSPYATDVRDGDWTLVFRAERSADQTFSEAKFGNAWNNDSLRSDADLMALDRACYSPSLGGCSFFRSHWMADWPSSIQQVRLALFSGGVQVAEMIFDGSNSNKDNWYDTSRVITSSWSDITPGDSNNFFSVPGQLSQVRMFVATTNPNGNDCDQMGWLLVLAQPGNRCTFDSTATVDGSNFLSPQFLYSTSTSKTNFNQGPYGQADVMAIFIKMN